MAAQVIEPRVYVSFTQFRKQLEVVPVVSFDGDEVISVEPEAIQSAFYVTNCMEESVRTTGNFKIDTKCFVEFFVCDN